MWKYYTTKEVILKTGQGNDSPNPKYLFRGELEIVADPGEGPGSGWPPPPHPRRLFLDQTEARRAEKFFFETGSPSPLYLKNWARSRYLTRLKKSTFRGPFFWNHILIQKFPLWRADLKSCGFVCRFHQIRVDGSSNPERKSYGFQNIRIRVDGTWVSDRHYAEKRCA